MENSETEQNVTEVIRVLIVDNNPESREKTRALLEKEKDLSVVGVARTGREAIEVSQEQSPDVVVLDANTPDMDEITITEAICRRIPFAQVLILAAQVDPNYMRKAMLAGARDFIVKPPLADELRSAVYRAGVIAHERKVSSMRVLPQVSPETEPTRPQGAARGKVIQVYSPKGGTGCTTVATNLALALHSPDTKTILVDGNLQYGDVAVFLNEVSYHSIIDLAPRVNDLDPDVINSVLINHSGSGMDALAAPNRPEMAEKVTGEEFYKIIQYLRRMYSYIVIDTSMDLNEITLSTLDAADALVLVTTQEIPAIKNCRLFLGVVDALHISRDRVIFTLNRYDRQVALSPERISENLKQQIVAVVPSEPRIALRSENQGAPFVYTNQADPISKAILNLAELVRIRLTNIAEVESIQLRASR